MRKLSAERSTSIYKYAFDHHVLNDVLDILTLRQFLRESKTQPASPEDQQATELLDLELRKSALLASLLASSPLDEHKQKAIAFAILAYLDRQDMQYASYCYITLSRTDNIQQGKHITQIWNEEKNDFCVRFDGALSLEIAVSRALAALQISGTEIYLSRFQKQLWQELGRKNRIMAMSGPASSGKSFIVQNRIVQMCLGKRDFRALYVVPTKALLYEVSAALRRQLSKENVSIRIAVGEPLNTKTREILVLTPERCLRLLQDDMSQRNIDLIFFDEIQKMEDDERGVLFEYILNELLRSQKNAEIIIAGPYLKNLKRTIMQLSGLDAPTVESQIAPVYQLKTVFRVSKANKNQIEVFLKSASGKTITTAIPVERASYSRLKSRSWQVMAEFIGNYGTESTNIVYAPRRTTAEKYALAIAELCPEERETIRDERVAELQAFLSEEIHPAYSLLRCLTKGVAFHHGMIPEMAKMEIEELFKSGALRNLVCTTTLLEGVNLPADKIFIFRPFKNNRSNPLDNFEFGNLIGRAGRVNSKLNGSVYCVELADEEWANEKLDSDCVKEMITATSKALSKYKVELLRNLTRPSTQINAEQAVVYTLILLRHKALRNLAELIAYLESKNLSQEDIRSITGGIQKSIENLQIPTEIVRLNPTLDPLLQDQLYRDIDKCGLKNWFISRSPTGRAGGKREASFPEKAFYYQFEEIAERLNKIFEIEKSLSRLHPKHPISIHKLVYFAAMWIQQKPLSAIINRELKGESEDYAKIDNAILKVMERINNDVQFELVKYFKLWADILRYILENMSETPLSSQEEEKRKSVEYRLSIPEMLELGASIPTTIAMIRSGINRSAAIKATNLLPREMVGDPVSWLVKNKLGELPPIFQRHIKSLGF